MNLGAAIPQLFYDLIGRVIPGTIIIGCGAYITFGHDTFLDLLKSGNTSSFPTIIGFLFIAYILGSLLGGVWLFLTYPAKRNKDLDERLKKVFENMSRNFDLSQIDNFTAFAYDHVQKWQPNAGARIAKINAEQHMCGVIIVGALILAVLNVIIQTEDIILSLYMVLSSIAAFVLYKQLGKRFAIGLSNLLILSLIELQNGANQVEAKDIRLDK